MAERETISLDHFRILTERAGLTLTPDERIDLLEESIALIGEGREALAVAKGNG